VQIRVLSVLLLLLACQGNGDEHTSRGKRSVSTTTVGLVKAIPAVRRKVTDLPPVVAAEDDVPKTSQPAKSLANLTSPDFTRLITALSQCSALSEVELKRCPHYRKVLALLSNHQAPAGHRRFLMSSVGNRLLAHESAAVRWLAARLLKSIAQVERSSREKLIERLNVEQTPLVIATIMRTLGYFIGENEALKRTFITLSDHQSPEIRGLAVSRLAQLDVSEDPELKTLLQQKLASDPSGAVGKAVCLQLGHNPTQEALAKMRTIIVDLDHVANEACFVALTSTWVAPSLPKMSEQGFGMTLSVIHQRVKTNAKVPWSVIARIAQGSHLVPKKRLSGEASARLIKELTEFVFAAEQNIQARVMAVQALSTYDAKPQVFDQIVDRYQESDDVDYQLAARAKSYRRELLTSP
jgi:hypothetical protein